MASDEKEEEKAGEKDSVKRRQAKCLFKTTGLKEKFREKRMTCTLTIKEEKA